MKTPNATEVQRREFNNIFAENKVMLDNLRQLAITTYKDLNKCLVSRANVGTLEGNGMVCYVPMEDFSKTIVTSKPPRVTAKVLLKQHNITKNN